MSNTHEVALYVRWRMEEMDGTLTQSAEIAQARMEEMLLEHVSSDRNDFEVFVVDANNPSHNDSMFGKMPVIFSSLNDDEPWGTDSW